MLKVLVPVYQEELFISEIIKSYQDICEINTSFKAFWLNQGSYDIIHLHWPEYLFRWQLPTEVELLLLERVIKEWQQSGTKIVITRHNYLPHRSNPERYIPLYDLVYAHVDAVIHMGKHSETEYLERYKGLIPKTQVQAQIPHPIFTNYPNTVSKEAARKKLEINQNTTVMLVFGEVRKAAEKNLILKAFDCIDRKDKLLLAPGWRFSEEKEPINRLKWLKVQQSRKYIINNEFIPHEEVQYYFKTADFVFLPRVDTLNSGVPFLAAFFNTPVTGLDQGNSGEFLKEVKMPVFKNLEASSISKSINTALSLKHKESLFQDILNTRTNSTIGQQHKDLFNQLIENDD